MNLIFELLRLQPLLALWKTWLWARCLLVLTLLGTVLSAHAQINVSPSVVSLPLATGGVVNLRFNPPIFEVRDAVLCQDVQPALGVPLLQGTGCNGHLAVPAGRAQVLGAGQVQVVVGPQALAAAASTGHARPRYVHLFVRGLGAVGDFYVAVRINLIEPPRGPELSEVRLRFAGAAGPQSVGFFRLDQTLPPVEALLRFKGSGLLRARWEVVQPGDPEPSEIDLRPETQLSLAQRAQQHRWRLLQTVQTYLSATGLTRLPGPDPRLLPSDRYGAYTLLLRIEPSQPLDGASTSATPFVLPVLRYFIGATAGASMNVEVPGPIVALAPQGLVFSDRPLVFNWRTRADIALYRVELQRRGEIVHAARVRPDGADGITRYALPGFAQAQICGPCGEALRWRVVSVGEDGTAVSESPWVDIQWAAVK